MLHSLKTMLRFGSILLSFSLFGQAENTNATTQNTGAQRSFWARHLNVLQVEEITRFNYMDQEPHRVLSRDVQYRIRTRTQWKLTDSGSTYVEMRAENGQGFANSWNNLGIGRSAPQGFFIPKTFFLGQRLGSHLELQAGGIEFDRGAGTQRSYASGDGALHGYRLILDRVRPSAGFDKVGLTAGYVGNFADANTFRSVSRDMTQVNYLQLTGLRHLGEKGDLSAEIDSIRGIWFTRETLHWKATAGPIDDLQLELIARATDGPRVGYSASVSHFLDRQQRWQSTVILTDLPYQLFRKNNQPILLPQGEIEAGKRLSFGSSYAVSKRLQVGIFGGRLLDATPAKRHVAQIYVAYDYTNLVSRLLR